MVRRREDEVLEIIKSNPLISQKEIAERLGITRSSVGVHVNNLTKSGKIIGRGYVLPSIDSICIIGASNIDIYGRALEPLEKEGPNVGDIEVSVGGVSRNIADSSSKLGLNINLITAISNDDYGRLIQDSCLKEGLRIDKSCIFNNRPTSFYMGLVNQHGVLEYGITDMSIIDEITPAFINHRKAEILNSRFILLDLNLKDKTVEFILKNFKEKDIMVLPVSPTKTKKIRGLLQYIDLLQMTVPELEAISETSIENDDDLKKVCKNLLDQGLGELIVFKNYNSLQYFSKDRVEEVTIEVEKPANDQGVKEARAAGFIYARYKGLDLIESLKLSLAAGSIIGDSNQVVSPWLSEESLYERAGL